MKSGAGGSSPAPQLRRGALVLAASPSRRAARRSPSTSATANAWAASFSRRQHDGLRADDEDRRADGARGRTATRPRGCACGCSRARRSSRSRPGRASRGCRRPARRSPSSACRAGCPGPGGTGSAPSAQSASPAGTTTGCAASSRSRSARAASGSRAGPVATPKTLQSASRGRGTGASTRAGSRRSGRSERVSTARIDAVSRGLQRGAWFVQQAATIAWVARSATSSLPACSFVIQGRRSRRRRLGVPRRPLEALCKPGDVGPDGRAADAHEERGPACTGPAASARRTAACAHRRRRARRGAPRGWRRPNTNRERLRERGLRTLASASSCVRPPTSMRAMRTPAATRATGRRRRRSRRRGRGRGRRHRRGRQVMSSARRAGLARQHRGRDCPASGAGGQEQGASLTAAV